MATQPKRLLEVQTIDNVAVVNISAGRILDDQVITKLGDELKMLVEQSGHNRILLNFSKVEYLSSAALGKLIPFRKQIESVKGKLALSNIDDSILEIFKITGFVKIFNIFPDEQEALQFLQN
ncbi:MAG TPA: STAS domain-containing protein [Gemmatales bacterium]|nr:STAS domain-containing protein [Gemmatales bacterium]HMP18104.1 STAS domain-containing protein [Gemmatales bacterium]